MANCRLLLALCLFWWALALDDKNAALIQKAMQTKVQKIKGKQEMSSLLQDDPTCYAGKKLIKYMLSCPADEVRKVFTCMPLQTKRTFLKSMNIKEYDWFLLAFTQEQWQEMWHKLPQDEQKIIPPTKREQLEVIRDTWVESIGTNGWFRERDSESKDVFEWRARAVSVLVQKHLFFRTFPINVMAVLFRDSFEQALKKYKHAVNNIFKDKLLKLLMYTKMV